MFETAIVTYPSAWSQEMVSLLKKVRACIKKKVIKGSMFSALMIEFSIYNIGPVLIIPFLECLLQLTAFKEVS